MAWAAPLLKDSDLEDCCEKAQLKSSNCTEFGVPFFNAYFDKGLADALKKYSDVMTSDTFLKEIEKVKEKAKIELNKAPE